MTQVSDMTQLDQMIRARYPVIMIRSHEEDRVMTAIESVAKQRGRKVATWSLTRGLQDMSITFKHTKAAGYTTESENQTWCYMADANGRRQNTTAPKISPEDTIEPEAALTALVETPALYAPECDPLVFVFKDMHGILTTNMRTVRFVRDIVGLFQRCRHTLILLSPEATLPTDLEKQVALIDWRLPTFEELDLILTNAERAIPTHLPVKLNGDRERVINAMRGMTQFEASSALLKAIVASGELSAAIIPMIVAEKAQIVKKQGIAEFFDASAFSGNMAGGLTLFKRYAAVKMNALVSEKARKEGVDAPRGVLLLGVPGAGKSLMVKVLAGGALPLLRLDIGAVMGSLVGQSEANIRGVLKVAEALSTCILWIDEIEKAFGRGGDMDGGTSTRVLSTLLTWMQETQAQVYVAATCNDISVLPPELIQRFDDVFFFDLPNRAARKEILSIHLEKRGKKLSKKATDEIAETLAGFSGREIEKVVKAAIETAYYDGKELTPAYLRAASEEIISTSKTMAEKISRMRQWAQNGGARLADAPFEDAAPASAAQPKIEYQVEA